MRLQGKNKESIFSFLDTQARMKPDETAFVLLGQRYEFVVSNVERSLFLCIMLKEKT